MNYQERENAYAAKLKNEMNKQDRKNFYAADLYSKKEEYIKLLHPSGKDVKAACIIGDIGTLKRLKAKNLIWLRYPEFLSLAICYKHGECCRFFIEHGVDVNTPDDYGNTTLHLAAEIGDVELCKYLIAHGASLYQQNADGETPLDVATKNSKSEICKYLDPERTNKADSAGDGHTLHKAAESGDIKLCMDLVANGADVNEMDGNEETPLYIAAACLNSEICKYLISQGADYLKKDDGMMVLCCAAATGDIDFFKYLIGHGVDISKNRIGDRALLCAVKGGSTEICKILIESGIDVNAKNHDGDAPLHFAADSCSDLSLCKYLISAGANINAKDNFGTTVFQIARDRNPGLASLLISMGVDVTEHIDVLAQLGETAADNDIESCKDLIAKGIGINTRNEYGDTALHVIIRETARPYTGDKSRLALCKYLISKGWNINAKNNDGDTALHVAARGGDVELCRTLISLGANINSINKDGFSALEAPFEDMSYFDDIDDMIFTREQIFQLAHEKPTDKIIGGLAKLFGWKM